MKTKTKKKKFMNERHPFHFQVIGGKTITIWANVVPATDKVTLRLTAADVRQSIGLNGVANTQTCSMAVCAKRQAGAFKHVVQGYIDWTYTRAYVVTKLDKNGMPRECVVYCHRDDVAKLNDTLGGQRRLLADLEKNGDRDICLLPITETSSGPSGKSGKRTGEGRTPSTRVPALRKKGAALRFAFASLGGIVNG
jgi:hypothetical protein